MFLLWLANDLKKDLLQSGTRYVQVGWFDASLQQRGGYMLEHRAIAHYLNLAPLLSDEAYTASFPSTLPHPRQNSPGCE